MVTGYGDHIARGNRLSVIGIWWLSNWNIAVSDVSSS